MIRTNKIGNIKVIWALESVLGQKFDAALGASRINGFAVPQDERVIANIENTRARLMNRSYNSASTVCDAFERLHN